MTFGNPFGLALYDKQQREVSSPEARPLQSAVATSRPAPSAQPPLRSAAAPPAAAAQADPGLAALDACTISQILTTLRGLPRPALEGFTKAFRKRFQVPEEAVTIADRIIQKCHHDWIEAFLVSHRSVRSAEHRQPVPA